jgi:hypothetical protein
MGKGVELLFGPPGNPKPGIPTSKAVARKLGLDDPLGKSAQFGMFRSSYPTDPKQRTQDMYPAIREEMVARLAEKS